MSVAVVNIGELHSGDIAATPIDGDAIVTRGTAIAWIGSTADAPVDGVDVTVDAAGATVVPGFVDSHVHVTFGDYTPRQRTVGFLESYVHGGITTSISASEVHVPGRPTDVVGVKALAVAAQRCFEDFFPGGMTVYAGSVILEPGLTHADFDELRAAGVWLAKAGFGAFATPFDYVPVVHAARAAGLVVMCHTGGGSISGSQERIGAEALIAMDPDVAGHVNGGPTAMVGDDNRRIVEESGMALQLVQAGNLRSAIDLAERALARRQPERILIASDTPTGTGVIPLAILRTMAELVALGPLDPLVALAASTGNPGRAYRIEQGILAVGRPADLLVIDAPIGSGADRWSDALRIGDLPAVGVAVTRGEVRFERSRNTPPPKRPVRVLLRRA